MLNDPEIQLPAPLSSLSLHRKIDNHFPDSLFLVPMIQVALEYSQHSQLQHSILQNIYPRPHFVLVVALLP